MGALNYNPQKCGLGFSVNNSGRSNVLSTLDEFFHSTNLYDKEVRSEFFTLFIKLESGLR